MSEPVHSLNLTEVAGWLRSLENAAEMAEMGGHYLEGPLTAAEISDRILREMRTLQSLLQRWVTSVDEGTSYDDWDYDFKAAKRHLAGVNR